MRTGASPFGYSSREDEIVGRILSEFSELQMYRFDFANQWQEISELILPDYRNSFLFGSYNWPGEKRTYRQIDATGALALQRFAAICDSLITPINMHWHGLCAGGPDNDYIMQDHATAIWFEKQLKKLFRYRYTATANFGSQNYQNFVGLGAFGTAPVQINRLPPRYGTGLRYVAINVGEWYMKIDAMGVHTGYIRHFRLTAEQAFDEFGYVPPMLQSALDRRSQTQFNFLQSVGERPVQEIDPQRLDYKGMRWYSNTICLEAKKLMRESGYHTMPVACSRYTMAPNETYGRSPAMQVLPALKTLNAQKATFLKQGHKAADPSYLFTDDGIVDFSMRPGAKNFGGMSSEGKMLVGMLPTGNIQTNEKMMEMEAALIKDVFLVSLFQILTENPQMTATEVIERTNEKGILIAPTLMRQHSEYVGPLVHRELDVLAQQHLLDPMPPRLKEAMGAYDITNTSPLARAARAQEASGFIRTVETVKELVQITQDSSLLDPFDFKSAIPAMAEINGVPPSWMSDQRAQAQKAKQRAQAMKQQQAINALPNQAAMMKAQAAQAKAGMGQGQPGAGGAPQQQQPMQQGM